MNNFENSNSNNNIDNKIIDSNSNLNSISNSTRVLENMAATTRKAQIIDNIDGASTNNTNSSTSGLVHPQFASPPSSNSNGPPMALLSPPSSRYAFEPRDMTTASIPPISSTTAINQPIPNNNNASSSSSGNNIYSNLNTNYPTSTMSSPLMNNNLSLASLNNPIIRPLSSMEVRGGTTDTNNNTIDQNFSGSSTPGAMAPIQLSVPTTTSISYDSQLPAFDSKTEVVLEQFSNDLNTFTQWIKHLNLEEQKTTIDVFLNNINELTLQYLKNKLNNSTTIVSKHGKSNSINASSSVISPIARNSNNSETNDLLNVNNNSNNNNNNNYNDSIFSNEGNESGLLFSPNLNDNSIFQQQNNIVRPISPILSLNPESVNLDGLLDSNNTTTNTTNNNTDNNNSTNYYPMSNSYTAFDQIIRPKSAGPIYSDYNFLGGLNSSNFNDNYNYNNSYNNNNSAGDGSNYNLIPQASKLSRVFSPELDPNGFQRRQMEFIGNPSTGMSNISTSSNNNNNNSERLQQKVSLKNLKNKLLNDQNVLDSNILQPKPYNNNNQYYPSFNNSNNNNNSNHNNSTNGLTSMLLSGNSSGNFASQNMINNGGGIPSSISMNTSISSTVESGRGRKNFNNNSFNSFNKPNSSSLPPPANRLQRHNNNNNNSNNNNNNNNNNNHNNHHQFGSGGTSGKPYQYNNNNQTHLNVPGNGKFNGNKSSMKSSYSENHNNIISASMEANDNTSSTSVSAATGAGTATGATETSESSANANANPKSAMPEEIASIELLENIPAWLKMLRLHKYTDCLQDINWKDLIEFDDSKLEEVGVSTLGARNKLLKSFKFVKENLHA
ncbi:unnamed protein product [[Candida] boidinii]|uniref:Unnamed protein product n=1 Tax=Candida boidinii TaxID=5477 RepID=A0A9W6WEE4_CANBO|nr:unnamed protein product [[Candida] boidinii]